MKSCAIILAAGYSTRMQQFKPLLSIGGKTITDRLISLFSQNSVDVLLVSGWQQEKLRSGIKNTGVQIINNPDYHQGMFTSIQAGLQSLGSGYEAFFIMPVDIPLVRPSTIKMLLEKFRENPEKIIFPVFGKKRGHPPLIPVVLRPTILGWKREGNLKEILDSHEKLALEINVPDNNILLDIDTPDDYARLQKRFHFYEIPTEEESEIILTDICQVPYNIRLHCIKVAEVADNIGKSLVKAGQNPDLDVIHAAAMLHDIAKGKFEHDITGGRWLSEMGFAKTGKIVSVHTDLGQGNEEVSLESKIVYLADKFVKGDKLVSLEERYQSSFNRCGSNPEVEAIVLQRQKRAKSVKEELDRILGYPLEQIIDNL